MIDAIEGREAAVLVDASSSGAAPGTIHRFDASAEPVPARSFRSSTHAFGVGEAIELARALGKLPGTVVVYGIEGCGVLGRGGLVGGGCRRGRAGRRGSPGGAVHERALMDDLMRKIESVARENGAVRVVRITVRLGALSHFTPEHFREHFVDASRGTLAEGAEVDAVLEEDVHAPNARRRGARERRGRALRAGRGLVMCVGSIAVLAEAWDEGAARVGRLDDGCVVPLSFVPDAAAGRPPAASHGDPGRGSRPRNGTRGARASRGRSVGNDHAGNRSRTGVRDRADQRRLDLGERARREALRRRDRLHDREEPGRGRAPRGDLPRRCGAAAAWRRHADSDGASGSRCSRSG